jgi:hypothetical protein
MEQKMKRLNWFNGIQTRAMMFSTESKEYDWQSLI